MGDFFLVLRSINRRTDKCIHDLLGPCRLLFGQMLVHANDAAGMVFPDVAGKAQHDGAGLEFTHGVKGFGDNIGVDLFGRQSGRHIRRRHDLQIDLIGGQLAALGFNNRLETLLAQGILQHNIMHGIPIWHGNLHATQLLPLGNAGVLADH